MQNIVLYIGTDFYLTVNVTGDIDIQLATAATATLKKPGLANITVTKAQGHITIVNSSLIIHLNDDVVTVPGIYELRITATVGGEILPISSNPETIIAIL